MISSVVPPSGPSPPWRSAVPTSAVTLSATAAPGVSQSEHAPLAKPKAKKVKVGLKRSATYSHVGQAGVTVTATVTKGKKKPQGQDHVPGQRRGRQSRSCARARPPTACEHQAARPLQGHGEVQGQEEVGQDPGLQLGDLRLGDHLHDLRLGSTSTLPALTGSVQFKDAPATKGYVDIYQNGNVTGGSGSPDYCCMAAVQSGGTFSFSGYSFLGKVQDKGPGTYSYQAFYTDDAGFDS